MGHHFGDFRGSWGCIEISMDFRISPGAPQAEAPHLLEGKMIVRGALYHQSQIANPQPAIGQDTRLATADWITGTRRYQDCITVTDGLISYPSQPDGPWQAGAGGLLDSSLLQVLGSMYLYIYIYIYACA